MAKNTKKKKAMIKRTAKGFHVQAKLLLLEHGYGAAVHLPLALGKKLGGGTQIPVCVTIEDIQFYAVIREHSVQDEFEYWVWHPVRYEMYVYAPMHRSIPMWAGMKLDLYFVREEYERGRRGYPVRGARSEAQRARAKRPTRARKP